MTQVDKDEEHAQSQITTKAFFRVLRHLHLFPGEKECNQATSQNT